jgi:phage virion morphogenesis protein
MTGIGIKVTVDNAAITAALGRLAEKDGGLARACLKNIGEMVVRQARAHIRSGSGPDGQAWAPLNPAYAAGKKGGGILQSMGMAGGLMGSIVWQLGGAEVEIGSNKVYAAIHQLGGRIVPRNANALAFRLGGRLVIARAVTIPARPYLGMSAADAEAILGVVADHAEAAWGA